MISHYISRQGRVAASYHHARCTKGPVLPWLKKVSSTHKRRERGACEKPRNCTYVVCCASRSHYTPKRGMKVRMALQVARVISYHGGEKTCPSVTGLDQGNRAAWERSPLGSKGGRFVTSESSASPSDRIGTCSSLRIQTDMPEWGSYAIIR